VADDVFGSDDIVELPSFDNNPRDVDKTTPNPTVKAEDVDHVTALKRYHRGWEHDRLNIERAYADLNFLAGYQWIQELENQRLQDGRPVLTFNRMGQFVRQVTGDIRQMRPAISVVPVNNGADEEIAEIREGLIRHIEAASNATLDVYVDGADSQVACGIGHWEVAGEYNDDLDYEQNLVVRILDDQISVIWDPDARKKTRDDAIYCFVPVDMTRDAYEEAYPDHPVNDMGQWDGQYIDNWYDDDRIRVCRYWFKKTITRKLVKMPDGSVQDVTNAETGDVMRYLMQGGMPYEREGFAVYHRMMNGTEFLTEPKLWPGRYIPIIPIVGEEVRIGGRIERHGIIRFLADPQRAYNYARSTQTEFVGLQPKAPFIGTDLNFLDYAEEWGTLNVKNWPYVRYTPDQKNGNIPPQRMAPPSTSPGLTECVMDALNDMQGVVGIYASSLGAKSNEDSGRAILAREAQGDTGTYVYMANFALAVTYTARILNDLIPHYYDTARVIRILGKDGKSRQVPINQNEVMALDGVDQNKMTDITVGTYDIQMEMGPSYATQREAAREGMTEFVKAFPPAAPILGDMFADLQDWPQKEQVVERLRTLLPPAIQAKIAEQDNKPPPEPTPPDPVQMAAAQAEMAKAQSTSQTAQLDVKKKELEVAQQQLQNTKAELELMAVQQGMQTAPDFGKMQEFMRYTDEALGVLSEHIANQMGEQQPEEPQEPTPEDEPPSEMDALKVDGLKQKLRHDEESHALKMKQAKQPESKSKTAES
jgi:hypothetical protein